MPVFVNNLYRENTMWLNQAELKLLIRCKQKIICNYPIIGLFMFPAT